MRKIQDKQGEYQEFSLSKTQQKVITLIMEGILLTSMFFVGRETAAYVSTMGGNVAEVQPCVVIDAGHGGADPGKIGVGGSKEKDINLTIANLVKQYLEANDVKVVMTRTEDMALCDESQSNWKVQDMKKRIKIIEDANPMVAVSIHQNSYTEEYVQGAQVFYYENSKEGETLASVLQQEMIDTLNPEKTRQIKPNSSYYLLKKTNVPIVIAECGFLSNWEEEQKLNTKEYQERVAWAIHMGIMKYLNSTK